MIKKWLTSNDNKIIAIIIFVAIIISFYIARVSDQNDYPFSEVIMEEATYIRFVYIGTSGCVFSNSAYTHNMIKDLKNELRAIAHKHGYRFLSTGISIDYSVERGIEFLDKSGPYDEIITGIGMFNLGAQYYVWNSLPGEMVSPQILIIKTKLNPVLAGQSIANIRQEDEILERIYGAEGINDLLNRINNVHSW